MGGQQLDESEGGLQPQLDCCLYRPRCGAGGQDMGIPYVKLGFTRPYIYDYVSAKYVSAVR